MAEQIPTKERRASERTNKPVSVIYFDGKQYPTRNLSVGGTLVQGYDGALSAGSLLFITGISKAGESRENPEQIETICDDEFA